MSHDSFTQLRYELAGGAAGSRSLTIKPLMAEHAERLGAGFAAIDPWASYPYPASALQAYFAAKETGAQLGMKESAVKVAAHRAVKKIREKFTA